MFNPRNKTVELIFVVADSTGYNSTRYTIPSNSSDQSLDGHILQLLQEHEKITGEKYIEVSRNMIGPDHYKVEYVIASDINDPYYNNFWDKPRRHIGFVHAH